MQTYELVGVDYLDRNRILANERTLSSLAAVDSTCKPKSSRLPFFSLTLLPALGTMLHSTGATGCRLYRVAILASNHTIWWTKHQNNDTVTTQSMSQACSSWIRSVSLLHPFWTLSEGTILDSILPVDSQAHLVTHFLLDNRLSFLFFG